MNALFGFDCLVKSLAVTSAYHQTTRKFVNYKYLAVLHNIIYITAHKTVRAYRLVYMMRKCCILQIRKVFHLEIFLGFCNTSFCKRYSMRFFINKIICVRIVIIFFRIERFFFKAGKTCGKFIHYLIQLR